MEEGKEKRWDRRKEMGRKKDEEREGVGRRKEKEEAGRKERKERKGSKVENNGKENQTFSFISRKSPEARGHSYFIKHH